MNLSDIKLKVILLLRNIKTIHVVIFVGMIIIVQGIWAYQTIITSSPESEQPRTQLSSSQNKISNVVSLVTAKNEFKVGEKISVTVNIESNRKTAGGDLILKYDPNLLSVVITTDKTPVIVGTIYGDYPVNKVDEKSGLITVSGITNEATGVIPKGVFGTILFQAKAAGNAKIFLEFTKGNTNDTNLIENQTANDILEAVRNLDLKITP